MEPNDLNSFLSTALLATLDLGILAWATQTLGRNTNPAKMTLLSLAVIAKFGLLALGFATLAKQPWFVKTYGAGGAIAPFALFLLWQVISLQRRAAAKSRS